MDQKFVSATIRFEVDGEGYHVIVIGGICDIYNSQSGKRIASLDSVKEQIVMAEKDMLIPFANLVRTIKANKA